MNTGTRLEIDNTNISAEVCRKLMGRDIIRLYILLTETRYASPYFLLLKQTCDHTKKNKEVTAFILSHDSVIRS